MSDQVLFEAFWQLIKASPWGVFMVALWVLGSKAINVVADLGGKLIAIYTNYVEAQQKIGEGIQKIGDKIDRGVCNYPVSGGQGGTKRHGQP